jgi:sulfur carrier protein ThiS
MRKIQAVYRGATSETGNETKDCTVRALANATEMPYEKAHALLKKHGRKDRKGVYFPTMKAAYEEAGFTLYGVYGTTKSARYTARVAQQEAQTGTTLAKLLPNLGFGEYIVNTTGHAVAVVNGKIIDTFDNPAGKRVVAVFKKIDSEFGI